ncbi:S9 family peptidase [Streptomyces oceani]|uniref:Peptidase S9 n=1 Tax=Streptomyces oceani TaxID=1075402 RepID=A0A1E7JJ37_9ACTN|nr:S9 family peptidase [Streptomyces oceani]OEU87654.1 peptidase S9 [Streptomyces oceani]
MATTFPRQYARTNRLTLGAPRAFTVAPDGDRVVFLRSGGGTDRAHALWVRDLTDGREFAVADPAVLLDGATEELSAEERARRERSREGSAGIVAYATDTAVELAAFALSGRLFLTELRAGTARELPATGAVLDPRPDPDGDRVAYVSGGELRTVDCDGTGERALVTPESDTVTYGVAEFVAAEEMQRHRGYWWSPDGEQLLVARVDDAPVRRWWIGDPANPERKPTEVAYPAAGTPNAEVTLHLLAADGSGRTEVAWDRERFPYLARVHWSPYGPPLLLVQARDQRSQLLLTVDRETGAATPLREERDEVWLELFAGVPAWAPDGRLVRIVDQDGARRLLLDDRPLTSAALHVRAVLDIGPRHVMFSASAGDPGAAEGAADGSTEHGEPGDIGVYRVPYDPEHPEGAAPGGGGGGAGWERLATEPVPHVASAVRGGETVVLSSAVLDRPGARATVLRPDADGRLETLGALASYAEQPVLTAAPELLHAGRRAIPTALLLPAGYRAEDGPLPVLMDPYGGPHGQRVTAAHNAHLTSQWFANQGFAVVVADGRGTPGRSPAWEKANSRDLAAVNLADQVDALHALAEEYPLDLTRVGIRGWSYGGFLAGLAVLRRPEVFHAAVVGAPVTDQRLYDTHYTERYLGDPRENPAGYAANSLVTDEGLVEAREPHRPMMLIHGLADDNVVVAHGLRLSSALLAAGRPHEVLPLSGVTHMPTQEVVAENLLLLQVDFLRRSLGIPAPERT